MQKISILLLILIGLLMAWVIPDHTVSAGSEDFIKYWAASKLLVEGANPYDPINIVDLCMDAWAGCSFSAEGIIVTWNPPWFLVFFIPLTMLPYLMAVRLWIVLSITFLVITINLAWNMVDNRSDIRGFTLALMAVFLYGNSIHLLRMGQITSLLVACLMVCVVLLQKRRDFLAGILILMLTIKFQIFYLILLIMFIWMIREKRWNLMLGGLSAILFALVISFMLNPGWLGNYLANITQLRFNLLYNSTLGSFAFWVFGQSWVYWLFIILLPFSFPLSSWVKKLGWLTVLNLTIAISVPLAPFGNSFDHVIYIPLIVQLIFWLRSDQLRPKWRYGIAAGLIFTEAWIFWFMSLPDLPYYWLVLPALALSGLYLTAGFLSGNLFSKQLAL